MLVSVETVYPKRALLMRWHSNLTQPVGKIDKDLRTHFQSRVRGLELLDLYFEEYNINSEWRVEPVAMVFLSAVAVISWTIQYIQGIRTPPSHGAAT